MASLLYWRSNTASRPSLLAGMAEGMAVSTDADPSEGNPGAWEGVRNAEGSENTGSDARVLEGLTILVLGSAGCSTRAGGGCAGSAGALGVTTISGFCGFGALTGAGFTGFGSGAGVDSDSALRIASLRRAAASVSVFPAGGVICPAAASSIGTGWRAGVGEDWISAA